MPTKTPAWAAKDGSLYSTAEQACKRDLFAILSPAIDAGHGLGVTDLASKLVDELLANSDTVVEALTTNSKARPGARRKPGTTNPRRAAKRATDQQAKEGFADMRQAANAA